MSVDYIKSNKKVKRKAKTKDLYLTGEKGNQAGYETCVYFIPGSVNMKSANS